MERITVKVEGMMCGMCEAHVNDAVRNAFPVKKVTSSRAKGETEIISGSPIDPEALASVIEATGYKVTGVRAEPFEKKRFGLFGK